MLRIDLIKEKKITMRTFASRPFGSRKRDKVSKSGNGPRGQKEKIINRELGTNTERISAD